MKIVLTVILVSVLMMVAAPAYAAEATQMWKCEMEEGVSEAEVTAMAQAWLKAAKTMPGGARFKASVLFPVAVNMTGQTDLMFVVVAPSFEEWGKFWDNYAGSPAEKMDNLNQEKVICPDSAVWESVKVE